jgi:hypothetical protein
MEQRRNDALIDDVLFRNVVTKRNAVSILKASQFFVFFRIISTFHSFECFCIDCITQLCVFYFIYVLRLLLSAS